MTIHDEIRENTLTHAMSAITVYTKQYADLSGLSICEVLKLAKTKIDDCEECPK